MITEPGLSNGVSQYDEDDTDLDFAEDDLRIGPDPERWVTGYKTDDTDLELEELEERNENSLVIYSRDPVRDIPNVFEVASYQVASKRNISLIADGPVDREKIKSLIDQLTADLDSGFFDNNLSN